MDTFDWRKHMQEKILADLEKVDLKNPDWHKPFTDFDPTTKQDIVIWYLKELVEKRLYVDKIFSLAKIYVEDKDPLIDDKHVGNQKLENGEEVRNITSVRGSACWLLTSIAATFRTEFYPEIISILERLASDPVYYIRAQSTVPISFFAQNINARQHPDGTVFDFKDEDRRRVLDISFNMLNQHRDIPRVLEYVVRIFDMLRNINEDQAREVIESLFYNSKKLLQPEYITRQAVPLLIFFAEFREKVNDGFNPKWFQDFALEVLKLPENKAPYLRSTFIWHIWKEIQSDPIVYHKFKKYSGYFLRDEFENEPLGQYEFFVKEALKISPSDGVSFFRTLLQYILKWKEKFSIQDHAWLLTAQEIIEEIAKVSPNDLLEILRLITDVVSANIYVGQLEKIYTSYLLVPNREEGLKMRPEVLKLFEVSKKSKWAGDLPDTI